jgi:hypothetical protein
MFVRTYTWTSTNECSKASRAPAPCLAGPSGNSAEPTNSETRWGGAILEFVQFADERENMLLHIFRLEAKASAEAAGEKSVGAQEPRGLPETGRGYNWQGVRPAAAHARQDKERSHRAASL